MTYRMVALRIRAEKALEARVQAGRDAGQGALEYVGMILVAALVAGAVWAALKSQGIEGKVSGAVTKILNG